MVRGCYPPHKASGGFVFWKGKIVFSSEKASYIVDLKKKKLKPWTPTLARMFFS
jgi:hypothetical protein